ncbi:MAG: gluconolaconase [Gammaproteobacteria bacterium]|nr:MAG: sorbosone dehydrogenase family protein [Pseudomonadota bacterium]MBC6945259.1 sorbosone dehydrogenase family protein [Gammaproteobacteria bacterium]MCE7901096.1 sorbosone dehydrogenase family protein [Gammaproteobacteria bacterium PRO9]MCQ3933957.1 sorbosone dehydrogenase family protein [Gammaproteobacteria bacterium]MDL1880118.1 sorbosone dehydrogenase family protein [Gammaproteobacteria bacterium PRO2]
MCIRLLTLCLLAILPGIGMAREELPAHLRLPPGFVAELLVRVPGARSMAMGPGGTLFVGTQRGGKVFAVRGALGAVPQLLVVAEGLKMPNGVAFHEGALYVAEPERILRFDGIEARLEQPPAPVVVGDSLPTKGMLHAWRYIAFGPDGKLYVGLGSPCNVCNEPGFSAILRMNPDGSGREYFARGIRNSVGFTWDPETGDLWFTDNGRDMLGDDRPADELNHATRPGLDFGFPYCHAGTISDPEFGGLGHCKDAVAPVQLLGPHVAALGLRFYTGIMFPAAYRHQVFIAEHGSWNRSKEAGRTGYRVTLVRLKQGKAVSYEPFIEGFLDGEEVLGRPVDLLVAADGALLVSDDTAGAIYRISYRKTE